MRKNKEINRKEANSSSNSIIIRRVNKYKAKQRVIRVKNLQLKKMKIIRNKVKEKESDMFLYHRFRSKLNK